MRHGGCIEEIADKRFDGEILHSVVIPLMTGKRYAMNGEIDPDEHHRLQYYVTTSGNRQDFAFRKMKEVMQEMAEGKLSFNIGFDYKIPVMFDLLDMDMVNEERESPSNSLLSYLREYCSIWTGSSEDSLVSLDDLNKCRTLSNAEDKAHSDKDKKAEYVLAYDVSRSEGAQNANCCLTVVKIIPRGDGTYQKHLVNLYNFEGTHFRDQALFLKKKVNEFNARVLIVDSLGIGSAVVDELVLEIDENPAYSVMNDDRYNKYKTPDSLNIVYAIQGNAKETKNSYIHNNFMKVVANKDIKMLKQESSKRNDLLKNRKRYDDDKLKNELQPFVLTDILVEEIMNLEYKQSGGNTVVKEISRGINKDKYSSLSYNLFWIYLLESKNKIRKSEMVDISKFMMVKKPKTTMS